MNEAIIKINNLDVEFTDEVPTKAGDFYAIDARLETRSMTSDYVSIIRVKPVHGVYVVGHLQQFNYLWSAPLVPVNPHAEETAYCAGWKRGVERYNEDVEQCESVLPFMHEDYFNYKHSIKSE